MVIIDLYLVIIYTLKVKCYIFSNVINEEVNMNYYNKIKNELIDNEIYKRVKDYSKNRYELERYYNVGK